ncbi:amidohydrolase family protein [Puniceibacterium confluentis]|uniref:amidohydrolase family protein n=1 Tax=Puniceibacterium confluentis TaxID=1958944 RepID=UPI0016443374|nr:amidohydrolase family protein [Puniceibacterium confluentis]
MTIVDIHPHIVSPDTDRYPITPIGGKRSDWSADHGITFDQLVAAMDAAGVDKAAIVHSSTTYGFTCDYVADAIVGHEDRFTGVFSVNVLEPDGPKWMQHWVNKGLSGMRIFARGSTIKDAWLAIDDPRIFPCYEYASEHGISMASNVTVDKFDQLENVLKRFPGMTFILDHLGKTDFTDCGNYDAARPLWDLAKYPNLYLKVATRNFEQSLDPETLFPKLVAEFGANRLAWGSNYPASEGTLPELLAKARNGLRALSDDDRDWVLGKTALTLYPALAQGEAVAS